MPQIYMKSMFDYDNILLAQSIQGRIQDFKKGGAQNFVEKQELIKRGSATIILMVRYVKRALK